MQRFFDFSFAFLGLTLGSPVFIVIFILGLFDTGSPIFVQLRVGRDKRFFKLIKFRTMRLETACVASHLAKATDITEFGAFLRKTKLDELPQLWNVLKGEMSLVGPRPCLTSQHKMIEERSIRGVFDFRPGITGLAQIRGIHMADPRKVAKVDRLMLGSLTLKRYFQYIFLTLFGKGWGDVVPRE